MWTNFGPHTSVAKKIKLLQFNEFIGSQLPLAWFPR
jgi:hypothetical protein